jgi:uncharacterized protein (DUF58 family)
MMKLRQLRSRLSGAATQPKSRWQPLKRIRSRIRNWSRKRHGLDPDPYEVRSGRIYILPTALGLTFGFMLFAMFLGAMNYGNNLALGLAFLLGALGLTAMHYSHRNLARLRIHSAGCEPVFAGQVARFQIAIENTARLPRYELTLENEQGITAAARIRASDREIFEVCLPASQRGYVTLEYFELATRHPFGLFRAWSYVHMNLRCIVYPKPSEKGIPPPLVDVDTGGAQDLARGAEDFAGFRNFHPGDSPRHIAWKAYAREQGLQIKLYAGTAVSSQMLDWDTLGNLQTEARLSQLCRWIQDAHRRGHAYGLKLPGQTIPPNVGEAHRQRCLTALALFEANDERDSERDPH